MLNALLLIFEPIPTWERIFRSQRSLFFIFWIYLVPLLALTSAGEAYRLVHWERPGEIKPLKPFSSAEAAVFESAQFLLSLGIVFIGVYPQPFIELAQKLITPLATLGGVALK